MTYNVCGGTLNLALSITIKKPIRLRRIFDSLDRQPLADQASLTCLDRQPLADQASLTCRVLFNLRKLYLVVFCNNSG